MPSPEAMRTYVMDCWRKRGWNHSRVATMADDQVLAIYRNLIAEPPSKFYHGALMSKGCQCGKPKKSGHSLCKNCFSKLPRHLQKALYRKIGHGYEAAYDRAVNFLKRK